MLLRARMLRLDGTTIVDDAEVRGENSKRGTHDGNIWRGMFSVPSGVSPPTPGETLVLSIYPDRAISCVVVFVDGSEVHFRAPGRVPTDSLTMMPE
jgi:hypothetical protein